MSSSLSSSDCGRLGWIVTTQKHFLGSEKFHSNWLSCVDVQLHPKSFSSLAKLIFAVCGMGVNDFDKWRLLHNYQGFLTRSEYLSISVCFFGGSRDL